MNETPKYYGKYQGTVKENIDPERRGRLRALVPDVLGDHKSNWAMPCLPLAGHNMGLYTVPPVEAHVWIEFEQGDPRYPIWVGGFWGERKEDIPALARAISPDRVGITLQTPRQNGIVISDAGEIRLQTASGASISISDDSIEITNGKGAVISLKGNTVAINGNALTIT